MVTPYVMSLSSNYRHSCLGTQSKLSQKKFSTGASCNLHWLSNRFARFDSRTLIDKLSIALFPCCLSSHHLVAAAAARWSSCSWNFMLSDPGRLCWGWSAAAAMNAAADATATSSSTSATTGDLGHLSCWTRSTSGSWNTMLWTWRAVNVFSAAAASKNEHDSCIAVLTSFPMNEERLGSY